MHYSLISLPWILSLMRDSEASWVPVIQVCKIKEIKKRGRGDYFKSLRGEGLNHTWTVHPDKGTRFFMYVPCVSML